MSTLTEKARLSDLLLFETGEEIAACRATVTVISGTPASVIGQIMGLIANAVTASETHAGNTGNGAMTVDVTAPVGANAQIGAYMVKCTVAAANGGTFRVFDPTGDVLGDVLVAGTFNDQIKFVIADGATDFIVGDTFLVTVAVGSGKYAQVTPAAVNGSQVAAALLLEAVDASAGDKQAVVLVRGPAVVKDTGISYTSGMSGGQKTTALAQLAALGITVRTAVGA